MILVFRVKLGEQVEKTDRLVSEFKFREAQFELMAIARAGNKYITDMEPWHLIKTDEQRVGEILNTCIRLIQAFAGAARPFLPNTAHKLYAFLNCTPDTPAGHIKYLAPAELLFTRIEDKDIELQIEKLRQQSQANQVVPAVETEEKKPEPIKPNIVFDEFAKMDIRVATILEAVKVEKADKLLKLTLDTGMDTRTVVSGIAEYFDPQDIIGKQVCLLANLEPRKLRGIESQGMILMTEDADGRLVFVSPAGPAMNGATVR